MKTNSALRVSRCFHVIHGAVQQRDASVSSMGRASVADLSLSDGDYVVMKPQTSYRNGDLIMATHLHERGSVTLMQYFQQADQVRLHPASQEMAPLCMSKAVWDREWSVQGKVVAILRQDALPDRT